MHIVLDQIPDKSSIYAYLFKVADEYHENIQDKIQLLAIEGKDNKVPRSVLEYLKSKGVYSSRYEFYEYLRNSYNKGKFSCYSDIFKIAEGVETRDTEIVLTYSQLLSKAILNNTKSDIAEYNLSSLILELLHTEMLYYKTLNIQVLIDSLKLIANDMKSYLQPRDYKSVEFSNRKDNDNE